MQRKTLDEFKDSRAKFQLQQESSETSLRTCKWQHPLDRLSQSRMTCTKFRLSLKRSTY